MHRHEPINIQHTESKYQTGALYVVRFLYLHFYFGNSSVRCNNAYFEDM